MVRGVTVELDGRSVRADHVETCGICGEICVCLGGRREYKECEDERCMRDALCVSCRLRCESCGKVLCREHAQTWRDEGPTIPGTMSDGEDHTLCSVCADIEERRIAK